MDTILAANITTNHCIATLEESSMICRSTALACATFLCCTGALLTARAASAADIDTSPLPLKAEVAFADVKWPGWETAEESGVSNPLRPILVTHAGDGSNRVFAPTQQGVIYVLPNDRQATEAKVFLDLQPKVVLQRQDQRRGLPGAGVSSEVSRRTASSSSTTPTSTSRIRT